MKQDINPAVENGWIPLFAANDIHLFRELEGERQTAFAGDVPVMPATVLGLELLLQESFIDLRLASELVLSDLGATIQVLRLTGGEFEDAEDRPSRMHDCIASLDVEDWFAAVSAHAMARDEEDARAAGLWEHSRLIAQYSQLVAESLEGVCAEQAYLVGLLHEIGSIRGALGRQTIAPFLYPVTDLATDSANQTAHKVAQEWCLPAFVIEALASLKESRTPSLWTRILSAAHELAGAGSGGVFLIS